MKNSKKTLIVAFIVIALVACMAIGFVGCGGTNLDGVYKETADNKYSIKIQENIIQSIFLMGEKDEKITASTTFTKEGDKLILTDKIGSIYAITIKEKNKIECQYKIGDGKEQVATYTKVADKK